MNFTFKRPELHNFITFKGFDSTHRMKILLDGDTSISVMPTLDCTVYIPVNVTGVLG